VLKEIASDTERYSTNLVKSMIQFKDASDFLYEYEYGRMVWTVYHITSTKT